MELGQTRAGLIGDMQHERDLGVYAHGQQARGQACGRKAWLLLGLACLSLGPEFGLKKLGLEL